MIKKCEVCGCEFETSNPRKVYCSKKCKRFHIVYEKHVKESDKLKSEGIEGIDYVIDQWNGFAVKNMYGLYMKFFHPGKTKDDYLREFPNAKLWCDKVKIAITKNSGKYMKTEKYKKMFSEKFKGEKNPNHRSKTTEQERKSRSPFCDEFYEIHEGNRDEFMKNISETRDYNTKIGYYESKGYTNDEAKVLLKERQNTFTLEKCIKKYGEVEGRAIFERRQKLWSDKIEKKYRNGEFSKAPKHKNGSCFSKIEKQFISMLIEYGKFEENKCKTYSTKQLTLFDKSTSKRYYYDFCYENKIIEFNGDYWHCNPQIYKCDYYHKILNCRADEIWKMNKNKIDYAESMGYSVYVVWENDFKKDSIAVIRQCLKYIFEK